MESMVSPIRPSLINWSPFSGLMLNVSRMRTFSPLLAFHRLHNATVRISAHPLKVGLGATAPYLYTANPYPPSSREGVFPVTRLLAYRVLGIWASGIGN